MSMKTMIQKFIIFLFLISILFGLNAQNDIKIPEEKPLMRFTVKDSLGLINLPKLTLPELFKGPNAPILPSILDNTIHKFWRPVYAQVALECGQASAIGFGLTYEINRLRDFDSSIEDNQYPPHFTWNFGNGGNGYYGVSYFHSFEIVKYLGCPTVTEYGGMTAGGGSRWMSGYDSYYSSMKNRMSEAYQIDVSTAEGIETAKHWLHNHLDMADIGGVAMFYTSAPYGMPVLPAGTPEAGQYVVTSWGGANHGLTISGYHDSICWDYNNDGQYTNDIDINNDGVITPRDWEIGGFRFANTYSGGPNFGNGGFSYMTYKSCADPSGNGGIWNNALHVIYAKAQTEPLLTAKIKLTHDCRDKIRVRIGVSTDLNSESPEYILSFPVFNFQGGCRKMQGGSTTADKTIEFGLDISPILNFIGTGVPARYFLLVDENDPSNTATGEINQFSIIDYTSGVNEYDCGYNDVSLDNQSLTKLWVNHTVNFETVSIATETLIPATVYEPYNENLEAENGTPPYLWEYDLSFQETVISESFPAISATQLNPGSSYQTVNLDFDFPFYDGSYDQIRVYSDGYIMFDSPTSWPYQVYDFLNFKRNKHIAPFIADLTISASSGDGVWFEGEANSAIIRWKVSVNGYEGQSELNFAVKLFENGDIKYYYGENNYPLIDWMSGISDGVNKYFQFTEVSGDEQIPENISIDLKCGKILEGFTLSREGMLSGTPHEIYSDYEINVRVSDANNLTASAVVMFSTDGTNYLIIDDYSVFAGDDNILEAGETGFISVDIKNLGDEAITAVNMQISIDDDFVTLIDTTEELGNFSAGETKTFTNVFSFEIDNLCTNAYNLDFNTLISDYFGEEWESHIYLSVHAPELQVGNAAISDGNNGYLDPGETADLIVTINNLGGGTAQDIIANLSSSDPFVVINTSYSTISSIGANSTESVIFNITADPAIPIGYSLTFDVEVNAANTNSIQGEVSVVVGQTPVLIVDLDPNASSAIFMKSSIENIGLGYEYLTNLPDNLNIYSSIFLCLGIYSDNAVLSSNDGQKLADYLLEGGNLYMEGGDTWFYDNQTPVHSMFGINGLSDGAGDLGILNGLAGTLCENMIFNYNGENNWIDQLEAISPAQSIFNNDSPEYCAAVSNDAGDYKTIGASFEFGGLSDGNSPSTKDDLMATYLEFFGVLSYNLHSIFTATSNEICTDEQLLFNDQSLGNIISWNWTFEGGNPASSTMQNPDVTYSTSGLFNVELIVSDGINSDTLSRLNYILVHDFPDTPEKPFGPDYVLTNLGLIFDYQIIGVANASSYEWIIEPEEAGYIEGDGINATVEWTNAWFGTAEILVRAINTECGSGNWSESLFVICDIYDGIDEIENSVCTIFPNPTKGIITLKINEKIGNAEILIVNSLNEIIIHRIDKLNANESIKFDLSAYPTGVYMLKVIGNKNKYSKKIIVY